jgi:hypothetical protein
MTYSPTEGQSQEGVHAPPKPSPLSTFTPKPGWVCIDVKALRRGTPSLEAIGLAATLLGNDDLTFTIGSLARDYGVSAHRAEGLVRSLVVAGFCEAKDGFFVVSRDHLAEAPR